jgi:hypothetical protein
MSKIDQHDYDELMADRPRKFTADEVGYRKAPRGSEYRCGNCFHFYARQIDGRTVCEIFRSPETDEDGVDPRYFCTWWNSNGIDHPLAPSPSPPSTKPAAKS